MSKRKGKDKNKAENKPPYFDLASLGSPQFRVVLFAAAMGTLGAYAPLFYLVSQSGQRDAFSMFRRLVNIKK